MPKPERLSEDEKLTLIALADLELGIPRDSKTKYWLAARWIESASAFKPYLVTSSMFDNNEGLELVSFYYQPKKFTPDDWDDEDESEIITGSLDKKSGRIRIVIDTTKREVPAAPIKSQIQWSKVPRFVLPDLDKIKDWSRAKDEYATESLVVEGSFRPESKSMAVRTEGMDTVVKYNSKLIPREKVLREVKKIHLKFPESRFEEMLSWRADVQCEFERLQNGSIVFEWMRARAPDAKSSTIRTLYETGQFDDFPFKTRATALLLSRGFTTKEEASEVFLDQVMGLSARSGKAEQRSKLSDEDFERFRWIYTETDFQRHRSIVESVLTKLLDETPLATRSELAFGNDVDLGGLWKRFELTWNRLSEKQQEAATLLWMGIRKMTVKSVAEQLLIGVDALKERWHWVKRRFRKAFPEFKNFRPSKTYTKSKEGSYIHWGLYWHKRAAVIYEVLGARFHKTGVDLTVSVPERYKGPKREKTKAFKDWEAEHKLKEDAVAQLDEPVDPEALIAQEKADLEATDKTPDLWDAFRPGLKRIVDLSVASPIEDDLPPAPTLDM